MDLVDSLTTVQVSSKIGVKKGEKTNTLIPQKSTVQVFTLELSYNSRKTEPMKTLTLIFTLVFTVMFSSLSYAGWTKVGENVIGNTFYVDFERIRKHGGYVYFWTMTDYLKPSPQGYLSNQSYFQGDCKLFRRKTLTEHYFTDQMGRGTRKIWELTEFQKKWMYNPPNTIGEYVLKSACSR